MVYYAFDVLYLDGRDLTSVVERKGRSKRLCQGGRNKVFAIQIMLWVKGSDCLLNLEQTT